MKYKRKKYKIFGIGDNKTGTKSLGEALKYLGFDHKTTDILASTEYSHGNLNPVFRITNEHESFEDYPWNDKDFYKFLDKKYPKSKFILTIRNIKEWSDSHYEWFAPNTGVKQYWKMKKYDKSKEIKRHTQRNEEIIEYFRKRKKDLLVIDICGGEGWEKLCPFLDKPIPNIPFPHINKRKDSKHVKTRAMLGKTGLFINSSFPSGYRILKQIKDKISLLN